MLDALAFLPVAEVPDGMQYIKSQILAFSVATELTELLAYFDATYVSGQLRSIHRPDDSALSVSLRRSAPMVPSIQGASVRGVCQGSLVLGAYVLHPSGVVRVDPLHFLAGCCTR